MSRLCYRVSSPRSANLIDPQPERLESADGARWVVSRNVKRQLPDRRYDGVRKYWLKHRVDGKVVEHDWTFDREEALAWLR